MVRWTRRGLELRLPTRFGPSPELGDLRALALRYGGAGVDTLRKMPPLGFVFGEFVSVGIWMVVAALTGKVGHQVFPSGGM